MDARVERAANRVREEMGRGAAAYVGVRPVDLDTLFWARGKRPPRFPVSHGLAWPTRLELEKLLQGLVKEPERGDVEVAVEGAGS